jgi:hypothetical protein
VGCRFRVILCFTARMSGFAGLLLRMVFMPLLGDCRHTEGTENQYNPKLTKGCHIHVEKGSVEIGGKSTTGNSF